MDQGRTRARLQAVITVVVVLWFMRWSAAATVPLAFALFVTMLTVPLARLLERWLPHRVAVAGALLGMVGVLVAFGAIVAWSAEHLVEGADGYGERLSTMVEEARIWAVDMGLPLPTDGEALLPGGSVSAVAERVARQAVSTITGVLLVAALAVLAVMDVDRVRTSLGKSFPGGRADRIRGLVSSMARQFQRYLVARTVTGLLNGVLTGVFALVIGLEFALVWGILTFLLNYIPTIGSVLSVLPPALFALLQFGGVTMPLVVLIGLTAFQLVMGNYVDPVISGRYVSLPPFVVLFSVVFWGWLWGIPGAFLGVPITVGLVIVTDHFPATRWMARLLGEDEGESAESTV